MKDKLDNNESKGEPKGKLTKSKQLGDPNPEWAFTPTLGCKVESQITKGEFENFLGKFGSLAPDPSIPPEGVSAVSILPEELTAPFPSPLGDPID
jgi:hypothetical protein